SIRKAGVIRLLDGSQSGTKTSLRGTHVVDCHVARNGENPHTQSSALSVEFARMAPDAQKQLLHQILGRTFVTCNTNKQRVSKLAVAIIDGYQCVGIPGLEFSD